MIAYKLLKQRKDGTLGPLFINRKQRVPLNEWLLAGSYPTKGYALRPGWHTAATPEAPHLSTEGRVWCKVEIDGFYEFMRPAHQGGVWMIANRMRILEVL